MSSNFPSEEFEPPSPYEIVVDHSSSQLIEHAVAALRDEPAYEYALRDAAARFEETRRLAAELAQVREECKKLRADYATDQKAAADREAELIAQLAYVQQECRDGMERETCELGARAQVADWKYQQGQKQLTDAEEQRRRAQDALRLAEAETETWRAEMREARIAHAALTTKVEVLETREHELTQKLETEREDHKEEVKKVSGAATQALARAASEAMASRREAQQSIAQLELEREARIKADAESEACRNEAVRCSNRALQAERTLEAELEKLLADRAKWEEEARSGEADLAARALRLEESARAAEDELAHRALRLEADFDLRVQRLAEELSASSKEMARKENAAADRERTEKALLCRQVTDLENDKQSLVAAAAAAAAEKYALVTSAAAEKETLVAAAAKAQAEADAAFAQLKAEADEAVARAKSDADVAATKAAADFEAAAANATATLAAAEEQAAAELKAAREQAAAELKDAKDQAAAELKAAKDQAAAELQAATNKSAAELLAAKDQAATEVQAAKDHAAAELQATKDLAAAELQAANDLAAAQAALATEKAAAEAASMAAKAAAEAHQSTFIQVLDAIARQAATARQRRACASTMWAWYHRAVELCRDDKRRLIKADKAHKRKNRHDLAVAFGLWIGRKRVERDEGARDQKVVQTYWHEQTSRGFHAWRQFQAFSWRKLYASRCSNARQLKRSWHTLAANVWTRLLARRSVVKLHLLRMRQSFALWASPAHAHMLAQCKQIRSFMYGMHRQIRLEKSRIAFITWHRQRQRAKHEHAQIGTAVLATRTPVAPLGGPRARAAASTRYDNVVAAPTPVISSPKQKQHVEALSYQVPPQPSPQTPPSSRSSRMPLPSSSQRVPPSSPSPRISSSSSITPAQHAAQLSTNQPPLLRSDDRRLVSKEELWRKLVLGKALRRWEHTNKERAWEHNAFALASLRMRQRFLQIGFETLRKVGYAEEHEMALRSLVHFRFTRFRQAGLSRSLLRWVQNTLEKSEMVQRTRALVQQHLTNKYTRLAWQEWLAVYQTTRGKLHILWSFNRGVNHVQRTFKRWQESGRHRHLRKAAAKFIALKQVQHRLNVWHTRVSCRSLELGKFGLKLATAHIMQRRNARFFRLWKNDCILRPKKVAQTADLAKRELTKAKVRNGLAHWRIEARRIRLHRTACKLRVMAATAVAQQTLITDDLRDFEVSATETINTWVHTANGLRSDLLRTQEQASRDREQATLEFTRAQDTARARLERMQEDARVELERSQDEAAKALQRAQAEAKVKLDRSLDEANKELQRTQSAAAAELERSEQRANAALARKQSEVDSAQQRLQNTQKQADVDRAAASAEQHRLSEAIFTAKSENDKLTMALQEVRETTAGEISRLGREAAQVPPLRQEVSSLRDELLQADASRNDAAAARAAAERESSRLLKENTDLQRESAEAEADAKTKVKAAEAAAEKAMSEAMEAERAALAKAQAAEAKAAAAARAQAHAEAMQAEAEATSREAERRAAIPCPRCSEQATRSPPRAPSPLRAPSPPPRAPSPPPRSPTPEVSDSPPPITKRRNSIFEPTQAFQHWTKDQREKRQDIESRRLVPFSAGRRSDTFGESRFLQEPSKDADRYPWDQGRSFADARLARGLKNDLRVDAPSSTSSERIRRLTPNAGRSAAATRLFNRKTQSASL